MTAETLKPFISATVKKSTSKNILYLISVLFFTIFCISILCLEIWNTIKTNELRQEVIELREEMRKNLGYDLDDDLNDYEDAYKTDDIETDDGVDDEYVYDNIESIEESHLPNLIEVTQKYPQNSNNVTLFYDINEDDNESEEDDEDDFSGDFGVSVYSIQTVDDDDDDDDSDATDSGETEDDDLETDITLPNNKENLFSIIKKRNTRSLSGLTQQGIPIYDEPYLSKKNRTHKLVQELSKKSSNLQAKEIPKTIDEKYLRKFQRNTPSPLLTAETSRLHPSTSSMPNRNGKKDENDPTGGVATARKSRVMNTGEDKTKFLLQMAKKNDFQKTSTDTLMEYRKAPEHHVYPPRRRMIKQFKRNGNTKPTIALHLVGDASSHFEPRIQLNSNKYIHWKQSLSSQFNSLASKYFKISRDGIIKVAEGGLYYVYAQVLYDDDHDTNGFNIFHNDNAHLQCSTMTHSSNRMTKTNSCFTASLIALEPDDQITIRDIGHHRYVLLEKSFFGMIRMGSL